MPNKAVWNRYKRQQLVATITQPNQSGILKHYIFAKIQSLTEVLISTFVVTQRVRITRVMLLYISRKYKLSVVNNWSTFNS